MHPEQKANRAVRIRNAITHKLEQIPFLGSLPYRVLGLRKETDRVEWLPTLITQTFYTLYSRSPFHSIDLIGELPKEGTALGVANHYKSSDLLKGGYSGRKLAGRNWIVLTRKGLLETDHKEHEEYTKGKENDFWYKDALWARLLRRFAAFSIKGVGAIPVPRGGISVEAIKLFNESVKEELLIGMFIQEERQKDGTLKNIQPGVGYFVNKYPELPVYPLAMYVSEKGRGVMRIGNRWTKDEIIAHPNFRSDLDQIAAITLFIADEIADMLPDAAKKDWLDQTRDQYIQEVLEETAKKASQRTPKLSN